MHIVQIPELSASRVLVVGDLMLDSYLHGTTSRISPEAPVPIVKIDSEEARVGGAGNVALNIAALGGQVSLLALVGADVYARTLNGLLRDAHVNAELLEAPGKSTIVKKRVISKNHQLLRIDYERAFGPADCGGLVKSFAHRLAEVDVVVLSDYAKGTLCGSRELIRQAKAAGKIVLVDPKGSDFTRYIGATLITPNLSEFEAVAGPCESDEEIADRAAAMIEQFELEAILVTKSERGMTLVQRGVAAVHLPTFAREVFDVTGAGDTVIATLAASLGAGTALLDAVHLSNAAAGVVVGKFGTATVTPGELHAQMHRQHSKIRPKVTGGLQELVQAITAARKEGQTIVLTNGCFDLLHPGHIDYLRRAKELGDRLVVLVNSDTSVRELKGPTRPINNLKFRTQMLAALECVDFVCAFDTPTPAPQIAAILPDILVKGGDYKVSDIAGSTEVLANGGRVEVLAFVDGFSSTRLIEKIRKS